MPSKTLSPASGDVTSRFQDYLRSRGKRYTPEREAILETVLDLKSDMTPSSHFTPEDVARALRRRGLRMSVVTVYRNLPVFCDAGILRRTCLSSRENLYEVVRGHGSHDHLICIECGKVVEFEYDAFRVLQKAVAEGYGFAPRGHHLEILGVCPACRPAHVTGNHIGN